MPKSDLTFPSAADYAPVAERIRLFYKAHPTGRLITRLVASEGGRIVFRAAAYRDAQDTRPAATGWASEREGDGDINAVACLENTETSAIGRALANLGFTASTLRPSAEEIAKANRARARLRERPETMASTPGGDPRPVPARQVDEALQSRADDVSDLLDLVRAATRAGLGKRRAESLRAGALAGTWDQESRARIARRLRRWIAESVPHRYLVSSTPAAPPR